MNTGRPFRLRKFRITYTSAQAIQRPSGEKSVGAISLEKKSYTIRGVYCLSGVNEAASSSREEPAFSTSRSVLCSAGIGRVRPEGEPPPFMSSGEERSNSNIRKGGTTSRECGKINCSTFGSRTRNAAERLSLHQRGGVVYSNSLSEESRTSIESSDSTKGKENRG